MDKRGSLAVSINAVCHLLAKPFRSGSLLTSPLRHRDPEWESLPDRKWGQDVENTQPLVWDSHLCAGMLCNQKSRAALTSATSRSPGLSSAQSQPAGSQRRPVYPSERESRKVFTTNLLLTVAIICECTQNSGPEPPTWRNIIVCNLDLGF